MMHFANHGRSFLLPAVLLLSATVIQAAPSIRTNALGYEILGPKVAVAQDAAAPGVTSFELLDASKNKVFTGTPSASQTVPGWAGMQFQTLDFSSVKDSGLFTLRIQPTGTVSDTFRIGVSRLFLNGGKAVVGFFNGMRNTSKDDHAIAYFGEEARGKHDVYGGWNDATGDQGKYLSHLSYANFMNPQQIPFVAWSLLRSKLLTEYFSTGINLLEEAFWGADYLLRVQDPAGYFYINVFNESWDPAKERTICAWTGDALKQGVPTKDYQAAWREGGGMSIAALALAANLSQVSKTRGDSSAEQYLAGAERGFAHLSASKGKWADDGRENLIDHTTALLAATELALATGKETYTTAAAARVDSVIAHQQPEGWFYADGGLRVWYHGVDEGLPVVALARYLSLDVSSERADRVRAAIAANLDWYKKITYEVANPFSYPRMFIPATATTVAGGANQAKGKNGSASTVEKGGLEVKNAFDGDQATRWGSSLQDSTGWLAVDLGAPYYLDSVAIVWEAAYAKKYDIQTSSDSVTWTTETTESATSSGRRTTKFASRPSARYVRMKGVQRSNSGYSYSIHEFEVYGSINLTTPPPKPGKTSYFMPHSNETGYWWQGENARIASMATSFILGKQVLDPLWRVNQDDTISRMATSALDWVTGSNPKGVSFMHGFGPNNPPGYKGATNIVGGIANGITSSFEDETTPEFMHYEDGADWKNWRWVEQWLPHDAWYLMGVSSITYSREHIIDVSVQPRASLRRNLSVSRQGTSLLVSAPGAVSIELRTLDGRVLAKTSGQTLSVVAPVSGLSLVVVRGEEWTESRVVGAVR